MNPDEQQLKEWCNRHNVKVIDRNKRTITYNRPAMQFFKDPEDFDLIHYKSMHQSEPLFTVEISESELHRISDFENQVFNNLKDNGHYRLFETLMEQKEEEKRLRNKYPAVKKAHEQYSLMLKLAQSGEL